MDLIELEVTNAEGITKTLLSCLNSCGFNQEFLEKCFLWFTCEDACVMFGVASRLQTPFPKIIIWYCSNHRLELIVNGVEEMR